MLTTGLFLATWAWMIRDVVLTDRRFVRHGPKFCWVTFVCVLPVIGPIAWLAFGRPMIPVRIDGPTLAPAPGPEDTDDWVEYIADR